jgi:hypothetical protein
MQYKNYTPTTLENMQNSKIGGYKGALFDKDFIHEFGLITHDDTFWVSFNGDYYYFITSQINFYEINSREYTVKLYKKNCQIANIGTYKTLDEAKNWLNCVLSM